MNQSVLIGSLHVDGQFLELLHFLLATHIKAATYDGVRIHEIHGSTHGKASDFTRRQFGQEVLSFLGIGKENLEASLMELKLHVSGGGFGNLMLDSGAACKEQRCDQIKSSMVHGGPYTLDVSFCREGLQ